MHRFYQHVKTAPGASCSLRCCGNRFANRILRNGAGHRDSRVLPKMRRYVRHAEAQATRKEIAAQLDEQVQDIIDRFRARYSRERQEEIAARMMADYLANLPPHIRIHDEVILLEGK